MTNSFSATAGSRLFDLADSVRSAWSVGQYRLAWYAVAAIIIFALAVIVGVAMVIYCSSKGMYFGTGYRSGNTFMVGCHPW